MTYSVTCLDSVPGMVGFARDLLTNGPGDSPFHTLALGRQVARCLSDVSLAGYCRDTAQRLKPSIKTDDEAVLYSLAVCDANGVQAVLPYLERPGQLGFYVALQLAEIGHYRGDPSLLGRAVSRLYDLVGVPVDGCDAAWEFVLADAMHYHARYNRWQVDRLQHGIRRVPDAYRTRAALDTSRLVLGTHYGPMAA